MQQKSNTFYFSLPEKKLIKKLIDSKYGKDTSPSDYDTTGGDYDIGVEGHIFQNTGERISGSTIERLTGLRNEKNSGVSLFTLTVVAKYLNFGSAIRLLHIIEHQLAGNYKNSVPFDLSDLLKQYTICLKFGESKCLELKSLHDITFEVKSSINMKLQKGDILEVSQVRENEEFICSKATRLYRNKQTSLGIYKSGYLNKIISIDLAKQTKP